MPSLCAKCPAVCRQAGTAIGSYYYPSSHFTAGLHVWHSRSRSCLMLDLAFGTVNCLWNAGVSVECGRWKAYIKAPDLYYITGSVSIIRPSLRSATINFYRLVLRGNDHVLLDGWTGTVKAELSSSIIGFRGIREDFDNHTGSLHFCLVGGWLISLVAAYRCIGVGVARGREACGDVRVIDKAGLIVC